MKKNTAILDTNTKIIKFNFNGEEFEVDIKEGDLHDSWNSIKTANGVLWDFNFTWEDEIGEKPYLTIYALTEADKEGYQHTIWEDNTSIKIVEIIGNRTLHFHDKEPEFNYRLNPRYEVYNGKKELQLKTKSLNKASDKSVSIKTFDKDPDVYILAIDSEGGTLKL